MDPTGFTFVFMSGDAVVAAVPEQVYLGSKHSYEALSEELSVDIRVDEPLGHEGRPNRAPLAWVQIRKTGR